jgi:hypothetical protein
MELSKKLRYTPVTQAYYEKKREMENLLENLRLGLFLKGREHKNCTPQKVNKSWNNSILK